MLLFSHHVWCTRRWLFDTAPINPPSASDTIWMDILQMACENIILLENSCEPKSVSRSDNCLFIVLYMKLICKGSFRLRMSTPCKIPLSAVQITRVDALVRVRKSSTRSTCQRSRQWHCSQLRRWCMTHCEHPRRRKQNNSFQDKKKTDETSLTRYNTSVINRSHSSYFVRVNQLQPCSGLTPSVILCMWIGIVRSAAASLVR
jgi:hypothetical protein